MITVEGWTDYEAADGTRSYFVDRLLPDGELVRDTQARSRFTFSVSPATAERITFRDVLQTVDHYGNVEEWRVDYIGEVIRVQTSPDSLEQGVRVSAISCFEDVMRNYGLVKQVQASRAFFNLGGIDLTPTEYVQEFVIDVLDTYYGIDWITLGTIDFTGLYSLAFERATPGQVLLQVRDATEGEVEWLRPDGTGYTLGLRTAIGDQTTPGLRVARDKNLVRLERERDLANMATVLVPGGARDSASQERATVMFATLKVTAIDSSVVTLADPDGGDDPIAFDDQFGGASYPGAVNRYLLKANPAASQESGDPTDLFLTEILDTDAAAQTVTVRNEDGLAVNDLVEIRADASRTGLDELENPAAIGSFGRIVRSFDRDSLRGERNFIPDSQWSSWTSRPKTYSGRADGLYSPSTATSITVTDFPADLAVKSGMYLMLMASGQSRRRRITADVTLSGAGAGTLTLASGGLGATAVDGYPLVIADFRGSADLDPPSFDLAPDDATDVGPAYWSYDRDKARDLTCQLATTIYSPVNIGQPGEAMTIDLSGLTADQVVPEGTRITNDDKDADDWARVLEETQADGSGNATVPFVGDIDTTGTPNGWEAGDNLTLTAPSLESTGGSIVPVIAAEHYTGAAPAGGIEADPFFVHYTEAFATLYVMVGISHLNYAYNASDRLYDSGGTAGRTTPRLTLFDWDGASRTEIDSVDGPDFTVTGGVAPTVRDFRLAVAHTMTADQEFTAHLRGIRNTISWAGGPEDALFVRYFMAALTYDPDVPPVTYSHAMPLWQLANAKLTTMSQEPFAYQALWADLSERTSADEPELGAWVRLNEPTRGIDVDARIVELHLHPTRRKELRVVLDTRPDLLVRKSVAAKARPVFVNVKLPDVQITTPAEGETLTVPIEPKVQVTESTPPPESSGALRRTKGTSSFIAYESETTEVKK